MQVYDERDEYGPAVTFFRACNVDPRHHLTWAKIGFWAVIAVIVIGMLYIGGPR